MPPVIEHAPRLIDVSVPDRPSGVVLVLHGGADHGGGVAVSPTQLSVLRMVPVARRIARAGGDDLAVFRLLNRFRGWNADDTSVHDARWALAEIETRLGPGLPACLVGHSLGGRAALLTAPHPAVRSAVALAPWVYPDDVPPGLDGERLLIVHGDRDRVASPARSLALAQRLRRVVPTEYVTVEGGKHAMLRHHRRFDGLAAEFAVETLQGETSGRPATAARAA
ncbi:alpha/beta hydrolase [Paraconexibacter sp.]|uniref:alpha/beta hydrolase n=1 Tax=Paraconexibacter sp. TaxID=2949640 RepID=UPI003568DFE3